MKRNGFIDKILKHQPNIYLVSPDKTSALKQGFFMLYQPIRPVRFVKPDKSFINQILFPELREVQ